MTLGNMLKQKLADMWAALRGATLVAQGDVVIAEWEAMLPENSSRLDWLYRKLTTPTGNSITLPVDGKSGDRLGMQYNGIPGLVSAGITPEIFSEYGYRLEIKQQFAEAVAFWSSRVAAFTASALAEVTEVTAGVAESVVAISEDVAVLNEVVAVVVENVELPPEVRDQVLNDIAGIRTRRNQDLSNLRAMASDLRIIAFDIRAGDLSKFLPLDVAAAAPSSARPILILGAIGAAVALLRGS